MNRDGDLRLNVRSPALKGLTAGRNNDSLKQAIKRKMLHNETFDEAWERIFSMKNSNKDVERLQAVKKAMENGKIGRDPDRANRRFSKAEALDLYAELERRQAEERLRKMVEETPDNYVLVTDKQALDDVVANLINEDIIVFDVESTGTDVYSDKIVGHVLSATSIDRHYYIPTDHLDDSVTQLDRDYVTEKLRPIYEDERIKKIAHNAKYDIQILKNDLDTELKGLYWDTMEAMRLLNENEPTYALKPLATKYLRDNSYTYGELFGQVGFNEIDLRTALAYAAKDGDLTYRLYKFQRHHLAKHGNILDYFLNVEMPLIPIVSEMELNGYVIDLKYARKYGDELRRETEQSHKEVLNELGDINLDSPSQLKDAIERYIGKPIKNTNAKQTLKPLSKKYPIIKELLNYRAKTKLLSTYIDALPKLINTKTGRLHTVFNQNGAKTGRFSSGGRGVNLQNQPEEARKMFVAPDGYVLLGGDWSQQEYRCLAYYTQEPALIENYLKGKDLYSEVASDVFKKPIEECGDGSVYRDHAKVLLLAVAYGGGSGMLSTAIGVTKNEAQQFLNEFFRKYPKVDRWIKGNQEFVRKNGFVWMDKKQRKRRLPGARNRDSNTFYSSVYTQSTNARVQGSAAIQTKKTMIELDKLCKRKTQEGKGEWSLWTVVHDEAILCVPETITEKDIKDFESVMVNTYKFGNIPNKCDIEIQRQWGESITAEEYINGTPVPEL